MKKKQFKLAMFLTVLFSIAFYAMGYAATPTLNLTNQFGEVSHNYVTGGTMSAANGVNKSLNMLTSAGSTGGNLIVTYTVTGLRVTDTVYSVSPAVVGSNGSVALTGWNTPVTNTVTTTYTSDPGTGAKVNVLFLR